MTNFCLIHGSFANRFVLVNTNDAGVGSLRQAIINANGTYATDTIEFNIADIVSNYFEGVSPARFAVIRLSAALPTLLLQSEQ